MLTARTDTVDVVVGLESGADDYVLKPFKPQELIARVRARLRRGDEPAQERLSIGDLEIDVAGHSVRRGGVALSLTPLEFDLLVALISHADKVVTREDLMSRVWDEHWFGSTKTLDVHIAALRRRLNEAPGEPSRITALRGVGYRWERSAPLAGG